MTQTLHLPAIASETSFADRAISYRTLKGFDHFTVALSVGAQP